MKASSRYKRMVAVLEEGPAISKVLADRMGVDYVSFGGWLQYEVARGRLKQIGTFDQAVAAGEAGIVDAANALGIFTRRDAPVYALPGTPFLPALPPGWVFPGHRVEPGSRAAPKAKGRPAGPITIGRRMMQHWGRGG